MAAKQVNLEEAVEIAPGVYWVGFYDGQAALPCNPYLIMDGEEAALIDPGSVPHFPVVATKVVSLIRPEHISTIVEQHQDPDLCGALPVFEEVIGADHLRVAAHSVTVYLITHYGIKSDIYRVDQNDYQLKLRGGRRLRFVHLPNLHAPGTIATYDEQTRVLFSGDMFGGFAKEWSLYATEETQEGVRRFHQAVMPCGALLRRGLARLRELEIDIIAPQHGSVIRKEQVEDYFSLLESLDCGWDLQPGGCGKVAGG